MPRKSKLITGLFSAQTPPPLSVLERTDASARLILAEERAKRTAQSAGLRAQRLAREAEIAALPPEPQPRARRPKA